MSHPTMREQMSEPINSKALTNADRKMAEAIKHARLAYQFGPSSYSMSTLQNCLAAAAAFDQYISDLAFVHSAEWLRRFPKIEEQATRRQRDEERVRFAKRHGGLR
jgi:hypothetical protein